jgi:hypothetical protein
MSTVKRVKLGDVDLSQYVTDVHLTVTDPPPAIDWATLIPCSDEIEMTFDCDFSESLASMINPPGPYDITITGMELNDYTTAQMDTLIGTSCTLTVEGYEIRGTIIGWRDVDAERIITIARNTP